MKGKSGIILLVVAALIVVGMYFVGNNFDLFAIQQDSCEPIYAYYKSYRCCDEEKVQVNNNFAVTPSGFFQCPSWSRYCNAYTPIGQGGILPILWRWYAGTGNCGSNFFGQFSCSEGYELTSNQWNFMEPGAYCYQNSGSTQTMKYEIWDYKLCDCQLGPCGVPCPAVPGSTNCGFVTGDDIFLENGLVEANGVNIGFGQFSYTVPFNDCYSYYPETNRHDIGNTCEACDNTNDCASKYPDRYTYNGKEFGAVCSGNSVQLYDCLATGASVCTQWNDANENNQHDPGETCEKYGKKTRCDLYLDIPVQCCPGTSSCGPNAFCDSDYVCKQTADCPGGQDFECGQNVQCDFVSTTLKTPWCRPDKSCDFKEQDVECCSDVNCPSGYYCDFPDYTCKVKPTTKQPCPYDCCQGEVAYFDKVCANNGVCCGNNECANAVEECDIQPVETPIQIPEWIWIILAIAFLAVAGYSRSGAIGAALGGVVGAIVGIIIYIILTTWWIQLTLLVAGIAGGIILIYLIMLAIPLIAAVIIAKL